METSFKYKYFRNATKCDNSTALYHKQARVDSVRGQRLTLTERTNLQRAPPFKSGGVEKKEMLGSISKP